MVYDSTISFTLDTICPWTYLAKKRLSKALSQFRESHKDADIKYTVKYVSYQLYPEASKEGESKFDWYKVSTPQPLRSGFNCNEPIEIPLRRLR